VFASVYVCSLQDTKRIGLRQWGCNTSKEDIKRSREVQDSRTKEVQKNRRRNPRKGQSVSAWWRTGHWKVVVWCAPDCPEGQPNSLRREAHNGRSRAMAPDCPLCTEQSSNGRIQWSTIADLNGRLTWIDHRTVWCSSDSLGSGQIQPSTATDPNDRLAWQAPDCLVCPSTERCWFL
jgi:hypothetical protein